MSTAITVAIRAKRRVIELETCGITIELLRVEPGSFDLGSPSTEAGHHPSEGPNRRVTLTRPFYLGKYPITQGQYAAVTEKTLPWRATGSDVAVDQLWYVDALELCDDLTRATGVTVSMPYEAQWEYACRAGTTTRFWSGDTEEDLARVGWYRGNAGEHAMEVGLKPANPWGFHDMHGNVQRAGILPGDSTILRHDFPDRSRGRDRRVGAGDAAVLSGSHRQTYCYRRDRQQMGRNDARR